MWEHGAAGLAAAGTDTALSAVSMLAATPVHSSPAAQKRIHKCLSLAVECFIKNGIETTYLSAWIIYAQKFSIQNRSYLWRSSYEIPSSQKCLVCSEQET